ncbi:MAG: L-threonylcarbamoyladenylate synthase [Candidatus Thioglobus sp.]|nr:MAG: L-threonylcarbamoyladenylate synthase [Candidatus Thioglobus sp.]
MNFQTRFASKILNSGGVISLPTDTIYGLSCLPDYQHSIEKMLLLKRRNTARGLILLASDIGLLMPYVQDADLLAKIQPQKRPTTYLLKAKTTVSTLIRGDFDTVAIRLTDNLLIADLCKKCNSALLSTSANISGKPTANSVLQLNVSFRQQLDFILSPNIANKQDNAQPSQIIDMATGKKIR